MSGFFSLGGGGGDREEYQKQSHLTNTGSNSDNRELFLFKNEEIYSKGFELWQQYYQLHQDRLLHQQDTLGQSKNNTDSVAVAYETSSYSDRFRATMMMRQGEGSSDGINCQDCGNQAKKGCVHMRCRTCCKSRGFQCQMHVKSTWVPAAKRRERQQQLTSDQQQLAIRGEHLKRLREIPGGGGGGGSTIACATTSRLPATTSGFELGHFPPEVNSSAVFRCVRVSSVEEDEHLAYQTAVNIGGHVFKGILYDQGPQSSSHQQQQPLHLMAAATVATSAAAVTSHHPNVGMIDPSGYPTPLNAFMADIEKFFKLIEEVKATLDVAQSMALQIRDAIESMDSYVSDSEKEDEFQQSFTCYVVGQGSKKDALKVEEKLIVDEATSRPTEEVPIVTQMLKILVPTLFSKK